MPDFELKYAFYVKAEDEAEAIEFINALLRALSRGGEYGSSTTEIVDWDGPL